MADLAASAVTFERMWTEGGTHGKQLSCRQVTLVLTAQGSAANKIPASVLQLTKIEQATPFVTSDDALIFPATPSYDGSYLALLVVTNATDATRGAPADVTATVRGVVKGYL